MARSTILATWKLAEALAAHSGLVVMPYTGGNVRLAGDLHVNHVAPPHWIHIEARYTIELRVPVGFPRQLPVVYETGARIQRDFHRLQDGALCLGSSVGQRLQLGNNPCVGRFIDRIVIPYLYGHAHFEQVRSLPFGELAHGAAGLEDDVRTLVGLPRAISVSGILWLAGVHRRVANKRPCPCGSGTRLGRCHNALINRTRSIVGRSSSLEQLKHIEQQRAIESAAL
jgi:hypothetical protein